MPPLVYRACWEAQAAACGGRTIDPAAPPPRRSSSSGLRDVAGEAEPPRARA
eukprot:CAMPEP_0185515282 /NCGR_PEP_ID=MMETSP1366-20130426/62122_1 /TAXON_ID=38817 /ORGANISM="Gephyrocapsa oceanica, Strain RCC1303" /LENGTH=51 /DNA_ID=CAMNT_0028126121 /DNA_START=79 /DNA_END=232 /DNA_ORIENTATION=+